MHDMDREDDGMRVSIEHERHYAPAIRGGVYSERSKGFMWDLIDSINWGYLLECLVKFVLIGAGLLGPVVFLCMYMACQI